MSETVNSLKQRLVGAFVILSLAIVFLPMIFDKPHVEDKQFIMPISVKPEFKSVEILKPIRPSYKILDIDKNDNKVKEISKGSINDLNSKSTNKPKDKSASKPQVKAEQKLDKQHDKQVIAVSKAPSKPKNQKSNTKSIKSTKSKVLTSPKVSHLPIFKNVWMVQLGTFGNAQNAYRLRDKLRDDGFDGHTKQVKVGSKKAVRVFTGPFVNKREAEKVKKRLDKKYKVESRLLFFDA